MPIKMDPGDSFALGLGLILLVNTNVLCKCYDLHSWLAAHASISDCLGESQWELTGR